MSNYVGLRRFAGRAFFLVLALLAWGVVGSDRIPSGIVAVAQASDSEVEHYLDKLGHKPEHDLTALRIFNHVVLLIKDNYVDPKRIDPKAMMVAALEHVEQTVPEVMVDGDAKSGKLKVVVADASKDFDISGVDSPWRMSFALKEVFEFIHDHLVSKDDTRDIEYAAVNGMLSTLDPHSVLLKPEFFKEMKLQTKGEFGGLGFVITMKEGQLTVLKVLKKTPAARMGIKPKDQITKIEEESTVNMDINDAVARLRGKPDSKVNITVARAGWPEPRRFTLMRAVIQIEAVESKLLSNNVGYVKILNFQSNTSRDLQDAIHSLRAEGGGQLKGLVLDLRNNPGGLLEQAIQVADTFLTQGTIVTTVGYSDRLREVKKAHPEEGDYPDLPLAVIVNKGSASASEIVAGAIKNLNRGVIVGGQTFGKGSVQVLYDFPDESALKLTIAQYLTPGDVSIQEVGITPDIELIRARIEKDHVSAFAPRRQIGEANLEKHFGRPGTEPVSPKNADTLVPHERPLEEVRYLRDEPKKKDEKTEVSDNSEDDDVEAEPEDTGEFKEDFEIRFARDLIGAAPSNDRQKMLSASTSFVQQRKSEEEDKISKAIEALGVNWTLPAGKLVPGSGKLSADLKPPPSVRTVAGDTLNLNLSVENHGDTTLDRVWAYIDSENPYLDRQEFLFGTLGPGEKRNWTETVKVPKDFTSRDDDVTVKFRDAAGTPFEDLKGEVAFVELPRPKFAYSWQVVDNCPDGCNLDGIPQRGEEINLDLNVTDTGIGKTYETIAELKNAADEKIFIKKGRVKLGEIMPGQSKVASFVLEVKRGYKGDTFPVKFVIQDNQLNEYVTQKVEIPVTDTGPHAVAKKEVVRTVNQATVFAAATEKSANLATVNRGVTLQSQDEVGDFYRVEVGKGRFGYLPMAVAKEAHRYVPPRDKDVVFAPGHEPPQIEITANTSQGPIITDNDHFTLDGEASDSGPLKNMYVFVNDKKVYFHAAKPAETLHDVKFTTDFPLKVGNNSVVIVASEDADLASRRIVVIHRRTAELAQKQGKTDTVPQ
jgi:carboxyl-terminal processing protease